MFGLFAASDVFDSMFLEQDQGDPAGGQVKHLLWKGIVNPLRKYADICHMYAYLTSTCTCTWLGLYSDIEYFDLVWVYGCVRRRVRKCTGYDVYETPPPFFIGMEWYVMSRS